jgi:hypothetical protein
MCVYLSVGPCEWSNSAPKNLLRKIKFHYIKIEFHYNMTRITGTLREGLGKFISRSILLRMRNVSDKSCKENQHAFQVQ